MKTSSFLVKPGSRVRLGKLPTRVQPLYTSRADYQRILAEHAVHLSTLQDILYADDRYALLVIFQATDAAGKDGAIRHVMTGLNPQGCQVYSFKRPSSTDLDHDFLWRSVACLPERGRIGIFNRSYYEEVLVARVHPEILARQRIPELPDDRETIWKERFRSIADHEKHLHRNGTRIVKFFLHVSKEEQRRRLIARIDDPNKNWKFNDEDVDERRHWRDYVKAYEEAIGATSTAKSPWYIIPADDKENARLIVSRVLLRTLRRLDLRYPPVDAARRRALLRIRKALERS